MESDKNVNEKLTKMIHEHRSTEEHDKTGPVPWSMNTGLPKSTTRPVQSHDPWTQVYRRAWQDRSSPMIHQHRSTEEHDKTGPVPWSINTVLQYEKSIEVGTRTQCLAEKVHSEPGVKEWWMLRGRGWKRWLDSWMRRWIETRLVRLTKSMSHNNSRDGCWEDEDEKDGLTTERGGESRQDW